MPGLCHSALDMYGLPTRDPKPRNHANGVSGPLGPSLVFQITTNKTHRDLKGESILKNLLVASSRLTYAHLPKAKPIRSPLYIKLSVQALKAFATDNCP